MEILPLSSHHTNKEGKSPLALILASKHDSDRRYRRKKNKSHHKKQKRKHHRAKFDSAEKSSEDIVVLKVNVDNFVSKEEVEKNLPLKDNHQNNAVFVVENVSDNVEERTDVDSNVNATPESVEKVDNLGKVDENTHYDLNNDVISIKEDVENYGNTNDEAVQTGNVVVANDSEYMTDAQPSTAASDEENVLNVENKEDNNDVAAQEELKVADDDSELPEKSYNSNDVLSSVDEEPSIGHSDDVLNVAKDSESRELHIDLREFEISSNEIQVLDHSDIESLLNDLVGSRESSGDNESNSQEVDVSDSIRKVIGIIDHNYKDKSECDKAPTKVETRKSYNLSFLFNR